MSANFALAAFGGAGPLHAAEVAVECGIPSVLVPVEPGTLVRARHAAHRPVVRLCPQPLLRCRPRGAGPRCSTLFDGMAAEGTAWLDREAVPPATPASSACSTRAIAARTSRSRSIATALARRRFSRALQRFHAAHTHEYGYVIRARAFEFVRPGAGRSATSKRRRSLSWAALPCGGARSASRSIYVDARRGWRDRPVYQRERLPVAAYRSDGPAIINEMSATTISCPAKSADGRSPRQHRPAGGRMSTPVSTSISMSAHRRPYRRSDPDGGVLAIASWRSPRTWARSCIRSSFSSNIKERPRLSDRAVRRARPADGPGRPHPHPSRRR